MENVVTLEPIADPDYFLSGEFRDGEIVLQPYLTPEAIRSFDENAIPKLAGISNCEIVLYRKR